MFDIGFGELLVCLVVALVVLGPERLPGIARALGRWTGQARSYLRNVTQELERESRVAELKQQLDEARRELRQQAGAAQDAAHKLSGELTRRD